MSEETYTGGCHCGAVRFEAIVDISTGVTCNCSRCSRLGWILAFTPASRFRLIQGEDALTDYQFNRKAIHHLFCRICGIESFARGQTRDGREMAAVNVNCLDGVDTTSLTPARVDGASL